MTIRSFIRIVFLFFGAGEVLVFVRGGFESYPDMFMGGMMLFMASTNFCTQCPLLSAVTRMFKRRKYPKIETKNI